MKYELIHDTIARQVFNKASTEARTRRKVEKYISERYEAHELRGAKLNQDDIDYITPYLTMVNISREEEAFVEKGRKALIAVRRRQRMLVVGAIAVLLGFSAVSFGLWRNAETQKQEAETQKAFAQEKEKEANDKADSLVVKEKALQISLQEAQQAKDTAEVKRQEAELARIRAARQTIIANKARKKATEAKNAAEISLRKAKAESFAALSQLLLNEDPTKALRVAQKSFEYADGEPSILLMKAMMEAKTQPVYLSLTHDGTVNSAAFSPDQSNVLTSSWDKKIRIWDRDGKLMKTLSGHMDHVSVAEYSPDGKNILSGSWDGTARLWDRTGKFLREFKGHTQEVTHAAFAGNNKILTGSRDNTVIIWDLSGKKIATLDGHGCSQFGKCGITGIVISPSGSQILTTSYGSEAIIWDFRGNEIKRLIGHEGTISSAVFSNDGATVATASDDKTAKLWDVQSGKVTVDCIGHTNNVNSVCITESHIATASDDGMVGIWDSSGEGKLTRVSREIVTKVYKMPDGKVLALSDDGVGYFLETQNAKITGRLLGHDGPLISATIGKDGKSILTTSRDKTTKVWDLNGLQFGKTMVHGHKRMLRGAFAPDGKTLISTGGDTKLWSLDGSLLNSMSGSFHSTFSGNGKYILTSSYDINPSLFDEEGKLIKQLVPLGSRGFFTPENNVMSDKGVVYTMDGKQVNTFSGHTSRMNAVVYSDDGQYLVTASWDETAIIWKKDGTLLKRLRGHSDKVTAADISPDNKWIVSSSTDQTIKLWSFEGKLVHTFGEHGCGDNDFTGGSSGDCGINFCQFSPEGNIIASGGDDGVLIMRDMDGVMVGVIPAHERALIALDYSRNGDLILTIGQDGKNKIWYTPYGLAKWLEKANLNQLSAKDKKKYNIE